MTHWLGVDFDLLDHEIRRRESEYAKGEADYIGNIAQVNINQLRRKRALHSQNAMCRVD